MCVLIFAFPEKGFSFLNGFPSDRCEDMDPTKIKIDQSMIKKSESDLNNTEGLTEDALPTSVQLSESLNLYRIATSPLKYRRGKILDSKFENFLVKFYVTFIKRRIVKVFSFLLVLKSALVGFFNCMCINIALTFQHFMVAYHIPCLVFE